MSLFTIGPSRGPRWQIGLQAAIGLTVPIIVMTLAGRPALGFIAASGAFTVLYASTAPVVDRARMLPFTAAGLIISAALGALVAPVPWLVGVMTVVLAVVSAGLAFGFRLGPPGPLFFVLVFGLSAHVVATAPVDALTYVITLAAGCAFSYLVSLVPLVLPAARSVPRRSLRVLFPGPSWGSGERMLVLRVAIVAVLGVLLGLVIDPGRSYWIIGSAVAVIGVAPVRTAALQRGLHRFVGTVVGAGAYALITLLHPSGIWIALLLGALQFTIELVVVRHYASALVLITPLVLLLTGAATGEIGSMSIALERIIDTLIGAVLGAASGVLHPRAKPTA